MHRGNACAIFIIALRGRRTKPNDKGMRLCVWTLHSHPNWMNLLSNSVYHKWWRREDWNISFRGIVQPSKFIGIQSRRVQLSKCEQFSRQDLAQINLHSSSVLFPQQTRNQWDHKPKAPMKQEQLRNSDCNKGMSLLAVQKVHRDRIQVLDTTKNKRLHQLHPITS